MRNLVKILLAIGLSVLFLEVYMLLKMQEKFEFKGIQILTLLIPLSLIYLLIFERKKEK